MKTMFIALPSIGSTKGVWALNVSSLSGVKSPERSKGPRAGAPSGKNYRWPPKRLFLSPRGVHAIALEEIAGASADHFSTVVTTSRTER